MFGAKNNKKSCPLELLLMSLVRCVVAEMLTKAVLVRCRIWLIEPRPVMQKEPRSLQRR